MNNVCKFALTCIYFCIGNAYAQRPQNIPLLIDKIPITVDGQSRTFSFTNKRFGQFHGETNSYTDDGWRGWILREQNLFRDYSLAIGNELLPRDKSIVTVLPYLLERKYPNGMVEKVCFADSLDALAILVSNVVKPLTLRLSGLEYSSARTVSGHSVIFVSNQLPAQYILRVSTSGIIEFQSSPGKSPELLLMPYKTECSIIIDIVESSRAVTAALPVAESLIKAKRERINSVLERSKVITDNEDFNKAQLWAIASIDALITTQESKGIFAGLPWFNNNWGRDTFISLPGATYAINNFEDARDILSSFAEYQIKDSSDTKYYGRIPNRVTLKDSIYNTTDGTPWFVIQAMNYITCSGDFAFLQKIYPVLKTALAGTKKLYLDSLGFLVHRDAETWMDAVGPDGPWSPRGNRAIDIQELWLQQLRATKSAAEFIKDEATASECQQLLSKLLHNIRDCYFDSLQHKIADRLTVDGKTDFSARPNTLFAIYDDSLFINRAEQLRYFNEAMRTIGTPYGLLSLGYQEKNFHPFHEYPPFYPKDAAYHNGIIWQWNTGIAVSNLCKFGLQDSAWKMTEALTRQILHQGAVGTIAELMEAYPRPGEKEIRLSGTFSQAWSLGEYLRAFRQDYLGINYNAFSNVILFSSHLPKAIHQASFEVLAGEAVVKLDYSEKGNKLILKASSQKLSKTIGIVYAYNIGPKSFSIALPLLIDKPNCEVEIDEENPQIAVFSSNGNTWSQNSKLAPVSNEVAALQSEFNFCRPSYDPSIASVHPPDYRLLTNVEIKRTPGIDAKVIFDKSDPAGDEFYSYPLNSNFAKGILDITHFKLAEDTGRYYFTLIFNNLADPKWHPEYGYQLTYTAVLIHSDSSATCTSVGKNANFTLEPERSFNKAIYIGGGLEIVDCKNGIVAKYIPAKEDISNTLGNVESRSVLFSLPKTMIGAINKSSKITLLVGAQDDSGGAGLGVFREVMENPGEWNGGGKKVLTHNIYDILTIP